MEYGFCAVFLVIQPVCFLHEKKRNYQLFWDNQRKEEGAIWHKGE